MKTLRGFTLIELLVTIAILAIILAIAVPSYRTYVERANRSDGTSTLMVTSQALERCFTRFNAYNAGDCTVDTDFESEEGWYRITAVINAADYTLTATPQGSQAQDTECANFTLTHAGVRGVSGTGSAEDCW